MPSRTESKRRSVIEDYGGGMYFKRIDHVFAYQNLHTSSIPVSELAALVYVGNISQSRYEMSCNFLMK